MTKGKTDLLLSGSWHGRSCFVVGGGPSLRHFDFRKLRGKLTIGVNRAFEFFDPTVLLAIDARFYDDVLAGKYGESALQKFNAYKGIKAGVHISKDHMPGVREIRSLGAGGPIVPVEQGIYHGNNSGYSAIALALALGASPVYVLGIDMRYDGEKTHHHDGHPEKTPEDNLVKKCLPHFEALAKRDVGMLVKIVNPSWPAAPFSRLAGIFDTVPFPGNFMERFIDLRNFTRRFLRLEA
jgi:hypothetical protein